MRFHDLRHSCATLLCHLSPASSLCCIWRTRWSRKALGAAAGTRSMRRLVSFFVSVRISFPSIRWSAPEMVILPPSKRSPPTRRSSERSPLKTMPSALRRRISSSPVRDAVPKGKPAEESSFRARSLCQGTERLRGREQRRDCACHMDVFACPRATRQRQIVRQSQPRRSWPTLQITAYSRRRPRLPSPRSPGHQHKHQQLDRRPDGIRLLLVAPKTRAPMLTPAGNLRGDAPGRAPRFAVGRCASGRPPIARDQLRPGGPHAEASS
jgi:hypothetical protein